MFRKVVTMLAASVMGVMLCGMTAMAAPQTMADGGIFDAQYYAQNNPDVVAAFGTDANLLYQHYVTFGKAEGRLPYAPGTATAAASASSTAVVMPDGTVFDPVYYAQNNPDVVAAFGNDANALYNHYVNYGRKEGRLPAAPGTTAAQTAAASAAAVQTTATAPAQTATAVAADPNAAIRNGTAQDYLYIVNGSTKKFHNHMCRAAVKIAPENLIYTKVDFNTLAALGYSPCQICW